MSAWQETVSLAGRVPSGVWIALVVGNIVLTMMTWRVARARIRRGGERVAHPDRFVDSGRKRDVALTVASLVPAGLFWGMVLAGSFHGLVAFGESVLDWNGGAEYLVPGTLDGVSVTFAFLAFRAVHKHRDPGRCFRVVWAASLASATVNFAYEYGHTHNLIAGGYLALLSLFGMVIFHEFLAQFEEGAEYVRRSKRPPYGLRWLTAPWSTFQAFIAWENYPPQDGTAITTLSGLENLRRVRALKRDTAEVRIQERHARDLAVMGRRRELVEAGINPEAAVKSFPLKSRHVPAVTPRSSSPPTVVVAPVRPHRSDRAEPGQTKVPVTPAKILQWAQIWIEMCADGDLVHGPLNDHERARSAYGVSTRQLRNIRTAARTNALARKAKELDVGLPAGYTSNPPRRINGYQHADAAV